MAPRQSFSLLAALFGCVVLVVSTGSLKAQQTQSAAASRIAIFSGTSDAFDFARVEGLLLQAGLPARHVAMQDNWDDLSLLILVKPTAPSGRVSGKLSFTQQLATYYLRGGHVMVIGLPGAGEFPSNKDPSDWNALAQYFWDAGLHDINGTLEDSDHRALYFPGVANLGSPADFKAIVERVLAAPDAFPAAIPAEDFGPVPSIELRDNSLVIDGKAVFLKSVGDYDFVRQVPMREHAARFHRLHEGGFNSMIVDIHYDLDDSSIRQFLDLAHHNAIYIQFLVQGALESNEPLRKEYLFKFLRFRKHPAFIGWVFSDDMIEPFYPFISREGEIVKRYDDRQLPRTCTFLDPRRPASVQDWSKWTKLFPFPLVYLYPMQKDVGTLGQKGDIKGGIKDLERLADNTRGIWGGVFSEQFIQAHMQGIFARKVGLEDWTEHLLPMADQERLLAWRALLAGVKGLVFFYPESLEDQGMGRNRRNELAIAFQEMHPVEDILAGGKVPVHLHTSDDSVDATRIQRDDEAVIVVARDEPYYNRFVDRETVEGLSVDVGALPPGAHVYQLDGPSIQELSAADVAHLTLRPFMLTSLLLVTGNSHRVDEIRTAISHHAAAMAREAIDLLHDEQIKTEITARHIPADLRGSAALLESAKTALAYAQKTLAGGDAVGAFREARSGTSRLADYRAQAMRATMADADRIGAAQSARVYLNIYFSLPVYAYVTRGAERTVPGQLRREILSAEGIQAWASFDRVPY